MTSTTKLMSCQLRIKEPEMIEIKPIVTEQDYENALKAVEPYFDDNSLLTDEISAYFDAMITLIARFEETHFKF